MWEYRPITVDGDTISVDGLSGQAGLEWFTKTILDGLIPVCAPVGIYLNPFKGNVDGSVDTRGQYSRMVVRNNSFMETPLDIVTRTYGMLVIGVKKNRAFVYLTKGGGDQGVKGVMDFDTMPVRMSHDTLEALTVLSPNKHYCTVISNASITFFVSRQVGYRSMSDNAKLLQDTRDVVTGIRDDRYTVGGLHFMSVASDHTLNNFLHVRAELVDSKIKVVYDNGLTPDLLRQIWEEAGQYGNV